MVEMGWMSSLPDPVLRSRLTITSMVFGIPFTIPIELVQQLLFGDHLAGVAHQVFQDQIFETGEHG